MTRTNIGTGKSGTVGTNRGAEPVTTLGTPDISVTHEYRDFGYGQGATEIRSIFAARFSDARRRLPRHEIPFAVIALREEKARALEALALRCASKKDEAAAARRALERQEKPAIRRALLAPKPQLAVTH